MFSISSAKGDELVDMFIGLTPFCLSADDVSQISVTHMFFYFLLKVKKTNSMDA